MDSPKCKICGKRHYGICLDSFLIKKPGDTGFSSAEMEDVINTISQGVESAGITPAEEALRSGYNAYMREYMRKLRARAGAKRLKPKR